MAKKSKKGGVPINIFESVKNNIMMRDAAEYCGISVGRKGMAICPFHADSNPSLKLNKKYYYCFGCGAKGDVIDFVAQLLGLSRLDAAKKLAADFNVALDSKPVHKRKPCLSLRKEEERCYLELLESRKNLRAELKLLSYAALSCGPTQQLVNVCRDLERVERMLDVLAQGDKQERLSLFRQLREEHAADTIAAEEGCYAS